MAYMEVSSGPTLYSPFKIGLAEDLAGAGNIGKTTKFYKVVRKKRK